MIGDGSRFQIGVVSGMMLIIDDDEAFASNAPHFLSGEGWKIDVAREVDSATLNLCGRDYDVVLLDVALTGVSIMAGLDLVGTARRLQPGAMVIVISAFGSGDVVAAAKLRGADCFLHKPMSFDSIEAEVRGQLEHPR